MSDVLRVIKQGPLWRILRMPVRFYYALSYYVPKLRSLLVWVVRSREGTNLTYDLTADNLDYLAHSVSLPTGVPFEKVRGYIDEAREDRALHEHIVRATAQSDFRYKADERCTFGRRLGWYAFIRALKPRVVVETGVDKGLGAVLICAALMRNEQEGCGGHYYGTDIKPKAGWLLQHPYDRMGQILYGDSIESLKALGVKIDLFINDSDHSADYEYREYCTVKDKLTPASIILGDNAHATGKLAQFSREQGRSFLFFSEVPKDHWYPGGGIGISFCLDKLKGS